MTNTTQMLRNNERFYNSFFVCGSDPRNLEENLSKELYNLQDMGWNITNIDCHENPNGYWIRNGSHAEYHPSKEYIIIAWHGGREE